MANGVLSTNLSAETREGRYLFDLHPGNQADKNYHPQRSHGLGSLQLGDRPRNLFPVHCGLCMLRQEVCLREVVLDGNLLKIRVQQHCILLRRISRHETLFEVWSYYELNGCWKAACIPNVIPMPVAVKSIYQ